MPGMAQGNQADGFSHVLGGEIRRPLFLSQDEIRGGWRDVLPGLAECMPQPYPVFAPGDERILTWGYPIRMSEGILRLRAEVERLVEVETELRAVASPDANDRAKADSVRDRYVRALSSVIGNALLNDWGRGLPEVFLLAHSSELLRAMALVPRVARRFPGTSSRDHDRHRTQVAAAVAEQAHRAWSRAIDGLRRLAGVVDVVGRTTMVELILADPVLLTDSRPPSSIHAIDGYLRRRFRLSSRDVATAIARSGEQLAALLRRRTSMRGVVRHSCGRNFDPDRPEALLEPRLIDLIAEAELGPELGLEAGLLRVLKESGTRLKALEFLVALRRRMLPMEPTEGGWGWRSRDGLMPVAASTRPYDFTRPGIIDSSVHRFGLIYDLTNFTALLEEVRKGGRREEEKALQFMYIFQRHTENILERRRLTFEKFLGDGAFLSSRRATPVLVAACEIQRVYDRLRGRGFPFDQGIRIAVNSAEYRLLPMRTNTAESGSFEFFGHGIVELARLTTGKSTKDVEAMVEKLIHAGYDPRNVEAFFAPLAAARGGAPRTSRRRYTATLNERGDLINEGIVVTLPFLQAMESELALDEVWEADFDGCRWLVFSITPDEPDTGAVGLRMLGVARLKGLPPTELVEVQPWPEDQPLGTPEASRRSLVDRLRWLANPETANGDESDPAAETCSVPTELVVVCTGESAANRRWIFGIHRASDDVLTGAVAVALKVPELGPSEPIEMWLFRNRRDLARMYDGLRRDRAGVSTPMTKLREAPGFQAFYLAAPHRSP
jgi:hypothetical protein